MYTRVDFRRAAIPSEIATPSRIASPFYTGSSAKRNNFFFF